jgi:DNA-binding transcriptional MerR regulator/effector-binding domain-containing protein
MLSIGDFARYAQVSPRMLRHYDALGLLVPAHVDPETGHRSYAAAQFSRVPRLVALKDLGFTLEEIGPILDAEVSAERLQGMLLLRRAELERRIADDAGRLESIGRRLRAIESEDTMSDREFVEKPLPAVRVAQLTGAVREQGDIGAVIGPMFGRLHAELPAAGVHPAGPDVAWYEGSEDEIRFGAGLPVTVDAVGVDGVEVVDLPARPRALTLIHDGAMDTIGLSWEALMREVDARGLTSNGACREVYLEATNPDQQDWVTELQQPVD